MPTARELLEQADALMRRNRARDQAPPAPPAEPAAAVVDDVPELTEVAEVAVARAAEAGSVPDAVTQAVAPVPVQGEPADAPAATGVPDEAPPEGAGPPLREALARELAASTAVYPPAPEAPRALDDIPELTEIVEEIEAPSILDASAEFEMGEPSVWMEPGHGEVSILGRWPDVPAAADAGDSRARAAESTAAAPEVGVLHVAPDLLDAALAAALPANDILARGILAAESEPAVEPAAEPSTEGAFAVEDEAAPHEHETEVAWVEDEAVAVPIEDELEAAMVESEVATVEDEAATVEDEGEAAAVEDEGEAAAVEDEDEDEDEVAAAPADVEAEASPVELEAVPTAATPVPPAAAAIDAVATSPAAPATAAAEPDAERWDRLAEEVRMQVLQRIDIFTDTGLQEQLARRLQPMVDRASADLVATINHHVGALMRAYVAEAIEREIEKWREGSR